MTAPIVKGWLWIAIITLLATGCASYHPGGDPATVLNEAEREKQWLRNQTDLDRIKSWNLRGKLGIKSGTKGGSATLKWRYGADHQEIELYGAVRRRTGHYYR